MFANTKDMYLYTLYTVFYKYTQNKPLLGQNANQFSKCLQYSSIWKLYHIVNDQYLSLSARTIFHVIIQENIDL